MHTVYLVDDDQLVLNRFLNKRKLFLACGFEVVGSETNSLKALKEIVTLRPEVVLSDLKMPGLTGIELLEKVCKQANAPLFVIISAYGDFKDVRKFFLTYGFDYLVKPISDNDLVDLLGRLIRKLEYVNPIMEVETPSKELNEILLYLKEYSAMKHTLESVAEKYSLNPNTVCNLFSKHLNTTFVAYLTALRMKRADELLRTTDKPVKEIAIESGYSDYFYFCRVFREQHGMSPTSFRENAHE